MSHEYIVKQSDEICKCLNQLRFRKILSDVYLEHIMAIIHSVFMPGYHGKIANTKYFSEKHRTSVAHFLNDGKWDSLEVERSFRKQVVDTVYHESRKSGQPVFCIVDDTIASHTAPSSQALHPIEAAYYHMSHLKKCHDYGHQAVGVMLSCNGLSLNYAMVLYDKSRSKIEIVRRIAQELPVPPNAAYFLCDSWYTSSELIAAFAQKELIGLTRDCVDFENHTLRIYRQFVRIASGPGKGKMMYTPLKNGKERTITLTVTALNVLREAKRKQNEMHLRAGSSWHNEYNMIFTRSNGMFVRFKTLYVHFKAIVKRMGRPEVRFHDVRHTYATLSLQSHVDPKTLSEALGHATVAFTLDVYGHSNADMRQQAADQLERPICQY